MIYNNCTISTYYGDIIYYSHLIPVLISIVLIIFILRKTKFSLLALSFSSFVFSFCVWLILDLIAWISIDHSLIVFSWSLLDFTNIIFYILAAYFFLVFTTRKDPPLKLKIFLLLLILPAWFMTISGNSISVFDISTCEAIDNNLLTNYKLILEISVVLFITCLNIWTHLKNGYTEKRQITLVSSSLITFLLIFSVTEFISSKTGIYEINLYGLFILPIFLFIIIFATTSLGIFKVRIIGTQLLGYVIIILVVSQIFFYKQSTNQLLNWVSSILLISFSALLIKNAISEEESRQKIASLSSSLIDLNTNLENKVLEQTREITKSYESEKKARRELEKLSETKDQFLMIAQHNLRIPIMSLSHKIKTLAKANADTNTTNAAISEINSQTIQTLQEASTSIQHLVEIADDFKNMAEMKVGSSVLNLSLTKVGSLIDNVLTELAINIERMELKIEKDLDENFANDLEINIDSHKVREVLLVIMENAVRYNVKGGKIQIETKTNTTMDSISNESSNKILEIKIYNTGLGITKEEGVNLFNKSFYRSKRAKNVNPVGMGIGLSVSKSIIEAHHGNINIHSDGEGKGATVTILLPIDFYLKF